jgi:hypothetical protein
MAATRPASATQSNAKQFSFGKAFQFGMNLGLNGQFLRILVSFYLLCISMILTLLAVILYAFSSRLQSLFSMPMGQVFSFFINFGLAAVFGTILLLFSLVAASQWITVFIINLAKTLREKGRANKAGVANAEKAASFMVWRMLLLAIVLALISAGVNLTTSTLSDGTALSSLFYGMVAALISFAVAFSPYRLSLGGLSKHRVPASMAESFQLFIQRPAQTAYSVALAQLVAIVAIAASCVPLALILAGLASQALGGDVSSASFWFNVILVFPAIAVVAAGLAFSKLFTIGVMEYSHSVLWPTIPRPQSGKTARLKTQA